MNILVSIIVPVYCAEKYLDECIASLVNQTYKNIEIILIDDGSTDGSSDICDKWKELDERIVVIHNSNYGVSHSRNCGLSVAKGQYIAFCDADDLYNENYIDLMLKTAKKYNADITICSYSCLKNDKIIKHYNDERVRIISEEELAENIFLNNNIGGFMWNKLFKHSILNGAMFNEHLQICEDTHFLFQVLKNTRNICFYNKNLYIYRLHSSSAVNNVNNICSKAHRSKYTEVYELLLKEFVTNEIIVGYINSGIFMLAVSVLCDYKNAGGKDKVFKKNLNTDARRHISDFIKCKKIPFKKKLVTIGNWLFNLRRIKKIFNNGKI